MRMLKITVPASSANLGAGFDALGNNIIHFHFITLGGNEIVFESQFI